MAKKKKVTKKKVSVRTNTKKIPTSKKQVLDDINKKLWEAADILRINMDAAEYKHVVLGLIFLKYISDTFDEFRTKLKKNFRDPKHVDYCEEEEEMNSQLEDRDYYISKNIFWVPQKARWHGDTDVGYQGIQDKAKQSDIGKVIDDAMESIERAEGNRKLKGVLPKDFSRRQPNIKLGKLIDLISKIGFGDSEYNSKDVLGYVYEYFLGQFASAEGKKGGQFYTPKSVVNLIVECLEPYKGRVYDPAMGSGGFFVSSEKFIEAHSDKKHITKRNISIYGQESNPTTWKLSAMNMAIRGIEFNFGKKPADTFHQNQHPDLKADFIMANPPFNVSDWGGDRLRDDSRWKYGVPPEENANFAWIQHMVYHLSPKGYAGIVLANGSMSSDTKGEGEIRKNLIEADLVDCMITLPSKLFFNTPIPACIWILARKKDGSDGKRKRNKETLFIDARNIGHMISRAQKAFSKDDIEKLSNTYHQWRNTKGKYKDVSGFCKSTTSEEIKSYDYILTSGRYVGAVEVEGEEMPFDKKIAHLTGELSTLFSESEVLTKEVKNNLKGIGYDF